MKKKSFSIQKPQNPSEPIPQVVAKEGSEQKRRKVKKGGSAKASVVSASATDVNKLTAQYNLFTTDYYDVVDKKGNVIAVRMSESYKNKMFPKNR